jgi:hypothetical protein
LRGEDTTKQPPAAIAREKRDMTALVEESAYTHRSRKGAEPRASRRIYTSAPFG